MTVTAPVDDRPFGGGEGMVFKPEPVFECLESLQVLPRQQREAKGATEQWFCCHLRVSCSPRRCRPGVHLQRPRGAHLRPLRGRGRARASFLPIREISIGDFVLSGGELGAAIIIDVMTRLLPGALGNAASSQQESFTAGSREVLPRADGEPPTSTCASGGLLDYPHYTRPAEFRGMAVPEVLLNGNHDEIRRWRRRRALQKTWRNRPDLLQGAELSREDRKMLAEIEAEQNKSAR